MKSYMKNTKKLYFMPNYACQKNSWYSNFTFHYLGHFIPNCSQFNFRKRYCFILKDFKRSIPMRAH